MYGTDWSRKVAVFESAGGSALGRATSRRYCAWFSWVMLEVTGTATALAYVLLANRGPDVVEVRSALNASRLEASRRAIVQ